jgi:hypothetical protein
VDARAERSDMARKQNREELTLEQSLPTAFITRSQNNSSSSDHLSTIKYHSTPVPRITSYTHRRNDLDLPGVHEGMIAVRSRDTFVVDTECPEERSVVPDRGGGWDRECVKLA